MVIKQDPTQVEGWALPHLPPLITDILLSLDDKYLYFSNWLRGDICQYDIRQAPRSSAFSICNGSVYCSLGFSRRQGLKSLLQSLYAVGGSLTASAMFVMLKEMQKRGVAFWGSYYIRDIIRIIKKRLSACLLAVSLHVA